MPAVRMRAGNVIQARYIGVRGLVRRIANVFMVVVPDMLRLRSRFVIAIRHHCRPTELEGQKYKQQSDETTTHAQKHTGWPIGTS